MNEFPDEEASPRTDISNLALPNPEDHLLISLIDELKSRMKALPRTALLEEVDSSMNGIIARWALDRDPHAFASLPPPSTYPAGHPSFRPPPLRPVSIASDDDGLAPVTPRVIEHVFVGRSSVPDFDLPERGTGNQPRSIVRTPPPPVPAGPRGRKT